MKSQKQSRKDLSRKADAAASIPEDQRPSQRSKGRAEALIDDIHKQVDFLKSRVTSSSKTDLEPRQNHLRKGSLSQSVGAINYYSSGERVKEPSGRLRVTPSPNKLILPKLNASHASSSKFAPKYSSTTKGPANRLNTKLKPPIPHRIG